MFFIRACYPNYIIPKLSTVRFRLPRIVPLKNGNYELTGAVNDLRELLIIGFIDWSDISERAYLNSRRLA